MLKHDFCHEFKKVNVYQIKNRKSSIIFDDDDGDNNNEGDEQDEDKDEDEDEDENEDAQTSDEQPIFWLAFCS